MAAIFSYFGFEYEILEDKKNEVALVNATSAKGKTFIPKEVEYEGQKYTLTQITGSVRDGWVHVEYADKRMKPKDERRNQYFGAFERMSYSTFELIVPNTVTAIGKNAFYKCAALSSITIPNSVTIIGDGAFEECTSLTSVNIPNSLKFIGVRAFYKCTGLKKVNITDLAAWCAIPFNSWANPLSYAKHLYLNGVEVTDLIIPNSVTSIGKVAFCGCTSLRSVTIPSSVKSIDNVAFSDGCWPSNMKIETVTIENEEGEVVIHPRAFPEGTKILYVGKPKTKPAQQTTAAANSNALKWTLTPNTTIADMRKQFKDACGAQVKIYNGIKVAEPTATLAQLGFSAAKDIPFSTSMKVAAFIEQMKNLCGLKVKVYTCDEWVAALDDLTLESVGKVKKNATKADMEKLL